MSRDSTTASVLYFDGRTPIAREAVLTADGVRARIRGVEVDRGYATADLRVSPRIGLAPRFIALPDGGQLQCADAALPDVLPQDEWSEGIVAWLEGHRWVGATSVVMFVLAVSLSYLYALPAVAERIAQETSREIAQRLGRNVLDSLDGAGYFGATELPKSDQERLRAGFAELHAGLEVSPLATLEFRSAPSLGANAAALPGGVVVVTDDLVQMSHTDEEILAVLAHELAHAELRHPTISLLEHSGLAIIASAVAGDASVVVVAGPLATALLESSYSRATESQADEFGFDLLRRTGRSTHAFANIMQRLMEDEESGGSGLFDSHPDMKGRMRRARDGATDSPASADVMVLRDGEDLPAAIRSDLERQSGLQLAEDVVLAVSPSEAGAPGGHVLTVRRILSLPATADAGGPHILDYADVADVRKGGLLAEEGSVEVVTRDGETLRLPVPARLGWPERVHEEILRRSGGISVRDLVRKAQKHAAAGETERAAGILQSAVARLNGGEEADPARASTAADRIVALWLEAPVDADVVPLVRGNPVYPMAARLHAAEGWVHLRYTVDAAGRTNTMEVLDAEDPQGAFEGAAIEAVERFRYLPRIVDGVAVPREDVEIVLSFDIAG